MSPAKFCAVAKWQAVAGLQLAVAASGQINIHREEWLQ